MAPLRNLDENSSYAGRQAQLAWTLFVALAVGAAAFYQAVSPKRAILTRESAESFRATSTLAPEHSLSASMGVMDPQLGTELGGAVIAPAPAPAAGRGRAPASASTR